MVSVVFVSKHEAYDRFASNGTPIFIVVRIGETCTSFVFWGFGTKIVTVPTVLQLYTATERIAMANMPLAHRSIFLRRADPEPLLYFPNLSSFGFPYVNDCMSFVLSIFTARWFYSITENHYLSGLHERGYTQVMTITARRQQKKKAQPAAQRPHDELVLRQIFAAICYFDLFQKPLTSFEVWQNLLQRDQLMHPHPRPHDFFEVQRGLRDLVAQKKISFRDGFYFLNGRDELVNGRHEKYIIGKKKWDRAVFAARAFRFIPFVRMVAVCNTLAIDAAKESSDIDLLIIIKEKRIWTARLLITVVAHVLRIRRHGQKIAGRICLSFYMTHKHLDLSRIAIQPFDIYLVYYVTQVVVLYEHLGTKEKFFHANAWVREYLPQFEPFEIALPRRVIDSGVSRAARNFFERLLRGVCGHWLEKFVKNVQLRRMVGRSVGRVDPVVDPAPSQAVIISDTMLKFHEQDRRQFFLQEFYKRFNAWKP